MTHLDNSELFDIFSSLCLISRVLALTRFISMISYSRTQIFFKNKRRYYTLAVIRSFIRYPTGTATFSGIRSRDPVPLHLSSSAP